MPPPIFEPGKSLIARSPFPARKCLKKGYKKITMPQDKYTIAEDSRNEEYAHVPDMSDGYTYRFYANFEGERTRFSVWQNDLIEAFMNNSDD